MAAAETVGNPDSLYDVDRYGFLVCKSPLDGTLQRVEPKRLRAMILYLSHHPAWQDTRSVRGCIAPSVWKNITGLKWPMMPSVLFGIVHHARQPGESW